MDFSVREVEEETGLKTKVLDESIFVISASPIVGHVKKGKYIPAHTHLDVVFLLEADDKQPLIYRKDESKGAKWMTFEEAVGDNIVYFIKPVHERGIKKLKRFY